MHTIHWLQFSEPHLRNRQFPYCSAPSVNSLFIFIFFLLFHFGLLIYLSIYLLSLFIRWWNLQIISVLNDISIYPFYSVFNLYFFVEGMKNLISKFRRKILFNLSYWSKAFFILFSWSWSLLKVKSFRGTEFYFISVWGKLIKKSVDLMLLRL